MYCCNAEAEVLVIVSVIGTPRGSSNITCNTGLNIHDRIFSPQMAKKAEDEFSKEMREQYKQKQLYQTLKVARIDQQKIDANVVVVTVLGQLLTTAAIGEEPVTEPSWVKLNLKMVRNPYLGRNQRFPYMVVDFWNSTPEKLSVTKED